MLKITLKPLLNPKEPVIDRKKEMILSKSMISEKIKFLTI